MKISRISFVLALIATPTIADNLNIIQPITPEQISKGQKKAFDKIREYQNISEANALYNRQHPDRPRVNNPRLDMGKIFELASGTNTGPTYRDDEDPYKNPHEWDSISSKNKTCWIHKGTHKKICENKNTKP